MQDMCCPLSADEDLVSEPTSLYTLLVIICLEFVSFCPRVYCIKIATLMLRVEVWVDTQRLLFVPLHQIWSHI